MHVSTYVVVRTCFMETTAITSLSNHLSFYYCLRRSATTPAAGAVSTATPRCDLFLLRRHHNHLPYSLLFHHRGHHHHHHHRRQPTTRRLLSADAGAHSSRIPQRIPSSRPRMRPLRRPVSGIRRRRPTAVPPGACPFVDAAFNCSRKSLLEAPVAAPSLRPPKVMLKISPFSVLVTTFIKIRGVEVMICILGRVVGKQTVEVSRGKRVVIGGHFSNQKKKNHNKILLFFILNHQEKITILSINYVNIRSRKNHNHRLFCDNLVIKSIYSYIYKYN